MSKKKLTTQEILAAARAQASHKGQDGPAENNAPQAVEPAVEQTADVSAEPAEAPVEQPAAPPRPAAAAKPKSTKDILAAARAQATGGGKAAAGGGGPKSTKDILAAARAQGTGGQTATKPAATKPAAAAKPAAAKTAVKSARPAGDRPSIQEMLKAAREGKKDAPAAAPQPAQPRMPKKPVAARKKTEEVSRRRFVWLAVLLTPFAIGWVLLGSAAGVFTLAVARFMFPNVLIEPPSSFKIGPPGDYPFGTVATKWVPQFGIWVVHTEYKGRGMIYALSTVCTHLGCTPNWLDGEQKFKCPCHGSGFYITGVNFEGPAPRPLERHGLRIAEDGMLEVDKSVKFQEELGQWDDPASFVEVV